MVNKYKRKTEQAAWCETAMKNAMKESETTSVTASSKKYGIPLSTLQRHLRKGSCSKNLGRYRRVFNDEQEAELLEYVFQVDDLFYGLTKNEFLKLVYEYAERNNIVHPFKNGSAGNDWYLGFKKRHPNLVVRQPEPTSIARARGFNRPQVYRFYDLLEREINEHDIDSTGIYNMDETGIHASSNKPPTILSKSGKKQVSVISSSERGKLTTVICCCNAAGSFIPPFFIYGRKRMVGRLLDGAPLGSLATCTDNGWINGPKFLDWLHHFVENTHPTPEKKVILILDNHESHKYIEALEYARKNNLIFISLPPHTTHRMQLLDRCVYGPFKTYFEQEVSTFQRSHVGRIITQYDVAALIGKAYLKAASAQNAVQGFKSSGIWPTNRHIFSDADFLPASLTDRAEVIESTNACPSQIQSTDAGRLANNSDCSTSTSVFENVDHKYSQASRISLRRTNEETSYDPAVEDDPSCSTTISENSFQPVEELLTPHVKPLDIRPLPKPTPNKTSRKRKTQRAEILTSSPFRNMQIEKEEKKKRLSNNAVVKKKFKNLPSTSKLGKTKKQRASKKKNLKEYFCLVCGDPYEDPPLEDWIECGDCKDWAHEACTTYSGRGSYFCELCQE
ncbi:uncharacterized protein [Parasteatoda tepidariorum]|uniref:uncharacterized protein n=1 Tax=Parasteatoda tepidariorum TaxID=114398 RepID=UPI0039BD14F7